MNNQYLESLSLYSIIMSCIFLSQLYGVVLCWMFFLLFVAYVLYAFVLFGKFCIHLFLMGCECKIMPKLNQACRAIAVSSQTLHSIMHSYLLQWRANSAIMFTIYLTSN
jgi:hypothetical protein